MSDITPQGGPRILDTSTLGAVRIDSTAETPLLRATRVVMAERGCSGDAPCHGGACSCGRMARLVLEAVGMLPCA
jgi:hypothetical protein